MPCFELNHIVSYIWSQPLFVRSGGRMWDRMILQSKYLYACYDAHGNKKGVGSLENCRKFVWSPITSWLQSGFIEYGTGCLEEVFFFFFLNRIPFHLSRMMSLSLFRLQSQSIFFSSLTVLSHPTLSATALLPRYIVSNGNTACSLYGFVCSWHVVLLL